MKRRFTILTAALALLVSLAIPMGVWGQSKGTVTDNMTAANLAATGTSYTAFSNVSLTSDAVYAGKSALNNNANIQLRSNGSDCGIVTTVSGGKIKSITISVASGSNTIDVYGKNTAYTGAEQLFNSNNQGTKLGSVSSTGTISVSGDYEYVGIRSYNGAVYISSIDFVWETTGSATATTVTIDASGITNNDVYVNTAAGSLSATVKENANNTVISDAEVAWSSSDESVAIIDEDGEVTLVASGTTTITASYAGESGVYSSSSATYALTVTSSAPYVQPTTIEIIPNYTFWGKTGQFSGSTYSELSGEQDNVTLEWSRGSGSTYANMSAMRFYKDNTLVFTAPEGYEIISIVLTVSGTYSDLTFSPTGYDNTTTTWTGAAETVTMTRPSTASGYAQISKFVITIGLPSDDPSISANDVIIAYDATSGEIAYTLSNPVNGGSLSVSENVDWISDAVVNTSESKVTFTTTANDATTSRSGVIVIVYTYGDNETISKNVTVTQDAAPVIYSTIPALFAAAISTETNVLVTFNNWVVSGVSTNGKNVFVTDNNGNGFVIYYNSDMSGTYAAGDILSGTAVSCSLKKYNGFAELLNVDATDLTITSGGTVSIANVALAGLAGVNTGALLHYDNLTCSVDNNKYYLSDGTTTIQVYNSLFAFETLENGKTYNITGIYQQYNNTKEILPRSAADIEEVQVQHNEYTLTIGEMSHVTEIFLFDSDNESESIEITNNAATITDGTTVLVSFTIESGYVFQSVNVTYGDNQTVEITEITPGEYYSFDMPAANSTLTISATEYVAPSGDQYELYSGALVEGDYLIVYDGGAMNTTVTSDRLQYEAVTATNNVITTDNAAIVWHIAPSGQYWTIYNANADAYAASTGAKNKAQMLADGTDDKALWTVSVSGTETYEFVNKKNAANNVNANLRKNGEYGFACYATSTGGALSLYKKVALPINGYGDDSNPGGYYLIASPLGTINPANVPGMLSDTYDLYYFDQNTDGNGNEWINYKGGSFYLEPGTGYLYAHNSTITLNFTGTPIEGTSYEVTLRRNESARFKGWNLVGNPFTGHAYLADNRDFYTMNTSGTAFELVGAEDARHIEAMEGVFVIASSDKEKLNFTTSAPAKKGNRLSLNLCQGNSVIDRAFIRFGECRQLPKLQFNQNSTKLYIPMDDEDYAVVRAEEMDEMPVNFKAESNGTYSLNFGMDNVEFAYLHLIDNMTGNDIDLLQTPSFSFEAKTTDYENRFKLVFATGDNSNEDNFAYFSNGSFVINNEGNATLQVIDITGRIVKSESVNGCANVNVNGAAGVYMLRLVNGDNVKVQKVVVK